MSDKDWTETNVYRGLQGTLDRLANGQMKIHEGLIRVEEKLDRKVDRDDLAQVRVDMIKHSQNPLAHNKVGLTAKQWIAFISAAAAIATAISTLVGFSGCAWAKKNIYPVDPVEPTPIVDAGSTATCADAESRLILLGCDDMLSVCGPDEVVGTADDWSWKQWCENEDAAGVWEPIPKGCITGAKSCEEADGCFRD